MNTDIQLHPMFIKQLLKQHPELIDEVKNQQLNKRNKIEDKNITTSSIQLLENEIELDDVKAERSAEPLKNLNDIKRIRDYYLEKKQYRNHMLFLVGINIGLRIGDLLQLKFGHVIDENGKFKETIVVTEEKTGKQRKFALSNVSRDAINLYLKHNPNVTRNTHMFRNESTNGLQREVGYMSTQGVQNFLNKAFDNLNINIRHGTHMLRKTFAYHILTEGDAFERSRNLEKLQMLLGHSSPAVTLRYAGITDDEIYITYKSRNYELNLADAKLI